MINFNQIDNTTPVAGEDTAYTYFRFYLILEAEEQC